MELLKTTINHIARQNLGLSWIEYGVCEQIERMQKSTGWCNLSRAKQAKDIGITKPALIALIDRLVSKGVVVKNASGNTKVTGKWKIELIKSDIELEEKMSGRIGKETLPCNQNTGKETLPQQTEIGKETLPPSVKKLNRIGKETLPNTIYTKYNTEENTVCCKETAQQIEKNQEESTPETEHEWEEKAVRVIIQKIKSAPRPVKDEWNRHMPKIINYGFTADEVIEDCARKLLNYDQILRNLAGRELHDTAQALPQRRFLDFFGRSWLNNIKPKAGATIRQIPKPEPQNTVLPSFKHYRHA